MSDKKNTHEETQPQPPAEAELTDDDLDDVAGGWEFGDHDYDEILNHGGL